MKQRCITIYFLNYSTLLFLYFCFSLFLKNFSNFLFLIVLFFDSLTYFFSFWVLKQEKKFYRTFLKVFFADADITYESVEDFHFVLLITACQFVLSCFINYLKTDHKVDCTFSFQ